MTRNQLVDEIQAVCNALRAGEETVLHTTNAVVCRAELCYDNYGGHFENYLL